jgi:hypothetical protein
MPEQLPPGWTPEKYQTLAKFRSERTWIDSENKTLINGDINDIDPILISRNLVFHPEWLDFVGNGKQLTRQQFEAWLGRLDKVYDCYEDLIGSKPGLVEKIFVNLESSSTQGHVATASGPHTINIAKRALTTKIDNPVTRAFFGEIRSGGVGSTLPHEMAHNFMSGKPINKQNVTDEVLAELLVSYALESLNTHYGIPGQPRHLQGGSSVALTRGSEHRKHTFDVPNRARQNNTIVAFPKLTHDKNTVHTFYLLGMVETAGWDAYKKAFHSYNDPNFIPPYTYSGGKDRNHEMMRDFFDRLAHFSDNPNALTGLPDRGTLLEKHMPVTKTPNPRAQTTLGR